MTTISALIKEAEKAGCELDIDNDGSEVSITLDAPEGKVFKGTGGHVEHGLHGHGFQRGFKPNWKETMIDLRRIIGEGFTDCTDPECDICCPE